MIEDFENFIQTDESFLVVLDSRNATNDYSQKNGDNSNLSFKLQTPIIQPVNAINIKASVLNFTCPNSQYIINDTNNAIGISFDTSGTPYTNPSYEFAYTDLIVPLATGNYNRITFLSQLKTQLDLLANRFGTNQYSFGIFTVYFDETTNRISITNDRFYFFISQNVIFNKVFPTLKFDTSKFYTIGDVIGFDNTKTYKSFQIQNNDSTYSYVLFFPFPVNFGGLQNLNIHFENFKTYNVPYESKNFVLQKNSNQEFSNYSKANIACSVPVNCSPMEVIFYQKIGTYAFTVKDEQIDTITIALRDDLGNFLRLNGQNWNMTIEFILTKHTERRTRNFYSILNNPYPVFE